MLYPRVRHLGSRPIGELTTTGLTLNSMLGAWPGTELLQKFLKVTPDAPTRGSKIPMPDDSTPVDGLLRATLTSQWRAPLRGSRRCPGGVRRAEQRNPP
jgi:hypothetical protein